MKPRVFRFSHLRFAIAFVTLAAVIPLGSASANHGPIPFRNRPDQTITPASGPQNWTGNLASGANANYNFSTGEPCNNHPNAESCDIFLLHVDISSDPTFWQNNGGGVEVAISNYVPNPASDFDMQAFVSDSNGTKTETLAGSSGNLAGEPEQFTIPNADGYYLVQVAYFAVTASQYSGTIRFNTRASFPPDIDTPPGLQEVLASDLVDEDGLVWRSRSEMHIAQNPLNSSMFVAASKFYNKDPQSLAEYEFKIGTYVSFDRARSWIDLGQARVCDPTSPGSWKPTPPGMTNHTCYPADDPNADNEFAEEYITSDPWVQWDDDGNAYLMVLDSPPYPTGLGWGMTLHKWYSVSPADVTSGDTWGPRIPINFYPNEPLPQQGVFLDDKNTFAVNNAGPDNQTPATQTNSIVACWGLNIDPAIRQHQTCKLSVGPDSGTVWGGDTTERVISQEEQLNIGTHVVADPFDPGTFYATWLRYDTTVPGEGFPAFMDFNKTINATNPNTWAWGVRTVISPLDDIPRQFPGQSFRNLSIPIMAAGLRRPPLNLTELYVTWAEMRPVGSGPLSEAEIVLVRSDDAGTTWTGLGTSPKVVNGPDSSRDQFQPYVAITPLGQVNVIYFDRRHDPSNFFVDTFLSRSNDRGVTFSDHRLSHDATSPEFNAPVSGSGLFFGDYQGLVVDNCFAYPFVNDTHLANDAFLDPRPEIRDPDFDHGLPASGSPGTEFQQAIGWRVPNFAAFGGDAQDCPTSRRRSIPN